MSLVRRADTLRAVDQENEPELWWRRKGDPWEPPENGDDEEEAEEEAGGEGVEGEEERAGRAGRADLAARGIRPDKHGNYGLEKVLEVLGGGEEG